MGYQRHQQQPAYVLHKRLYRDTSYLLEILTQNHGRVSLLAKGARSAKHKGVLQLFMPLSVSWSGRNELMTLSGAEAIAYAAPLQGNNLLNALYLNELLTRLLVKQDACGQLFMDYATVLQRLRRESNGEHSLRWFEKRLLRSLGYELSLKVESHSEQEIVADRLYQYSSRRGLNHYQRNHAGADIFSGASLLALDDDSLSTQGQLRDAKRLMRLAFAPLLGDKPLKSRDLFILPREEENS